MNGKTLLVTLAAWLLYVCVGPPASAGPYPGEVPARAMIVALKGGGFVAFTSHTSAADSTDEHAVSFLELPARVMPRTVVDDDNVIHRLVVDSNDGRVFGYDLIVKPDTAARVFKVWVKPLSPEVAGRLSARHLKPSTPLPMNATPSEPRTVPDGATFALDVAVNPQTGVRIFDMVRVAFDETVLRKGAPTNEPARDFVRGGIMQISNYKLLRDGQLVAGGGPTGSCAGAVLWFSLPGEGRFFFSLVPTFGYDFRKVGVIQHNSLNFEWAGKRFQWISDSPIVEGGGNWYVWVLHEEPRGPDQPGGRSLDQPIFGPTRTFGGFSNSHNRVRRAPGSTDRPSSAAPARAQETPRADAPPARFAFGAAEFIEDLLPKP
jgi:hypothetical protein